MAASATSATLISIPAPSDLRSETGVTAAPSNRPRRLTPQAGKAIEILAHAIEYLADDFALDCLLESRSNARPRTCGVHPRIAAIEILKARNREIYLSCPEVPTLSKRLRSLLRLQRA